jgi:hypothetical protein
MIKVVVEIRNIAKFTINVIIGLPRTKLTKDHDKYTQTNINENER